jgi:hypothetical protein
MKIKTVTVQKYREYGRNSILVRLEADLTDDSMSIEDAFKHLIKELDTIILDETQKKISELDIELKKQIIASKHLESNITADTALFNGLQQKIKCAQGELNKKKTP